jgi:hypothetical protein
MVCLHIRNTEANVIQRLYPIAFIFLLAAPLLLAQDSQSNNSQPINIGGDWQISWQARNGSQQATIADPAGWLQTERHVSGRERIFFSDWNDYWKQRVF